MRRDTLYDGGLITGLVVVAVLTGLYYGAGALRLPVGPGSVAAAEEAYLGAVELGVTYRRLCLGWQGSPPVLAPNCKSTLRVIQAADAKAGAIYNAVKGHENNVSASTVKALFDAATQLRAVTPGG